MEKGKGDMVVVASDPYSWVSDAIKKQSSLFTSDEAVEMLNKGSWVREGEKIKVEFLPCFPNDKVCERREDVAYYYVYARVMADLKMKFPLTKFECQVLTQMNRAPSQLHPNSWAFLRAFEVLMEFLECRPSLGLFFSLFQVKGCWKGTYVNLNSFLGHSVFALYRTSYKSFQDMFVKVRSVLEEFPFYVNKYMCLRFSLYWSSEPIQILDVENKTEFEDLVLECLTSTEVMEEVLSCAELIKWEDDSQSEVSVSEVCKDVGGEGGYTSSRVRHVSIKRRNDEGVTIGVDKIGEGCEKGKEKRMAIDEVEKAFKSHLSLHGYKGSEDLSSLWTEEYPFTALAEDYG
ncbi:hypothetical protein PIB30_009176 [Stylosanthes scabra]|uniref:Transposase (putative) gypsy type domain-containing protein n=1 Tax=Stylosanthes scabra TaxID=79078 RepID=A0ABU6Y5E4_9FABA|nr:hypothetical protein [Stylosanthes scabra]